MLVFTISCVQQIVRCALQTPLATCQTGFFLVLNWSCQACPISCSVPNLKCAQNALMAANSTWTLASLLKFHMSRMNFFLDSTSTTCKACPPNCVACSDAITYTTCVSGFTLENDGLCTSQIVCPINSVSCSDENTCTTCNSSFYLDGTFICSLCPENCSNCVDAITCNGCSVGYKLSSGNNCSVSCPPLGTCQACIDGAFLHPDMKNCFVFYANCTSYTSPFECTVVCPTGYFLDNNSNFSSCLPHCEFCSDQNTCISCFKNFDLNDDNTISLKL